MQDEEHEGADERVNGNKTRKAQKRAAARRAAEQDARDSLLAAGYMPAGDDDAAEAVARILEGAPPPSRELYTIKEFCLVMAISESTYYRLAAKGEGPPLVKVLGHPRIRADDAHLWLMANMEHQSVVLPAQDYEALAVRMMQGGRKRTRRSVRAPMQPLPCDDPNAPPSIFDPPPPGALRRGRPAK